MAPALVRIGHGWAEGSVSVAQEHMATAVFRRVLGWLFRVYEVRGTAPRLVVATPPGQVHEFGALMVATSAAAEGWGVTYLGPDLPVADLVSAVGQTGARAVAVSAVYVPEGGDLLAALREMRAGLPERVPLLVGGAATAGDSGRGGGRGRAGDRVVAGAPGDAPPARAPRRWSEPAKAGSSFSQARAATSGAGCAARSRPVGGRSAAWPGGRSISAPGWPTAPKSSRVTCWTRARSPMSFAACIPRTT